MLKNAITFIIPCYNVATYIVNTLESLRLQSNKNWEAIIIDDASTDTTKSKIENFLETYKDTRITTIYKEQNQGVVKARKDAIEHVKTKYVAFLDGDDVITSSYVKKCLTAFNKNSSIDLIQFNHVYIDSKTDRQYLNKAIKDHVTGKVDIFLNDVTNWLGMITNKVYKLKLLKENLIWFKDDLVVGEDTPLALACLVNAKNIYYLDNYFYYYYKRNNSAVHTYTVKTIQSRLMSIGLLLAIRDSCKDDIKLKGTKFFHDFISSQLSNQERELNLYVEEKFVDATKPIF